MQYPKKTLKFSEILLYPSKYSGKFKKNPQKIADVKPIEIANEEPI